MDMKERGKKAWTVHLSVHQSVSHFVIQSENFNVGHISLLVNGFISFLNTASFWRRPIYLPVIVWPLHWMTMTSKVQLSQILSNGHNALITKEITFLKVHSIISERCSNWQKSTFKSFLKQTPTIDHNVRFTH